MFNMFRAILYWIIKPGKAGQHCSTCGREMVLLRWPHKDIYSTETGEMAIVALLAVCPRARPDEPYRVWKHDAEYVFHKAGTRERVWEIFGGIWKVEGKEDERIYV